MTKASRGRTFCKGGAEGVIACAIRPPRPGLPAIGLAIKVEDGNPRGYYQPALALLRWLGFDPPSAPEETSSAVEATQRNHRGTPVGEVVVGDACSKLPRSPWA